MTGGLTPRPLRVSTVPCQPLLPGIFPSTRATRPRKSQSLDTKRQSRHRRAPPQFSSRRRLIAWYCQGLSGAPGVAALQRVTCATAMGLSDLGGSWLAWPHGPTLFVPQIIEFTAAPVLRSPLKQPACHPRGEVPPHELQSSDIKTTRTAPTHPHTLTMDSPHFLHLGVARHLYCLELARITDRNGVLFLSAACMVGEQARQGKIEGSGYRVGKV